MQRSNSIIGKPSMTVNERLFDAYRLVRKHPALADWTDIRFGAPVAVGLALPGKK
jgi:hypothetical protein